MSRADGDRYGAFHVDRVGDGRWRAAVDHFSGGGVLKFDDVGFSLHRDGTLLISPEWHNFSRNPSLEEATAAFRRAEACLSTLRDQDREFARITQGRVVEMELLVDGGMAMVVVARSGSDGVRLI